MAKKRIVRSTRTKAVSSNADWKKQYQNANKEWKAALKEITQLQRINDKLTAQLKIFEKEQTQSIKRDKQIKQAAVKIVAQFEKAKKAKAVKSVKKPVRRVATRKKVSGRVRRKAA